jgi:hypothetical protein
MLPWKTWTMQRVSPDPHIGVKNTDSAPACGRLNCKGQCCPEFIFGKMSDM